MPKHHSSTILPYTTKQLFDLVSDIESYPKFIPWCEGARVYERVSNTILADLIIHFRGITGKYTSKVILDEEHKRIIVELADGPFEYLYQNWNFVQTEKGTQVEFYIDFKIKNFILEKLADLMFDEACDKMMQAFIIRANNLCRISV
jgi:coenzyme Q-binding protein COQ10